MQIQNNEIIVNNLIRRIEKGESLSPFLFLSENRELLFSKVEDIALGLLDYFKMYQDEESRYEVD